ncbi:hypothetical protein OIO90_002947 [Microbotryomycetes sp. JL221]|nr:hypothetical protein OIO90_002947 [Microbotryomycetes sp. JL221]
MSAPSFSTDPATVHATVEQPLLDNASKPTGSQLAQDFKDNFGSSNSDVTNKDQPQGGERVGGHFNRITKRWERDDEYVVDTTQNASTMPEDESSHSADSGDKTDKKGGFSSFAKKFLGKEH